MNPETIILGNFQALSKNTHPGINGKTLVFQDLALLPQIFQGYQDILNKLKVFGLRSRLLVCWMSWVNHNMN